MTGMKIGVQMRRNIAISICLLCILALPSCVSGTDKLDAAMLKGLEIPKECKAIDGKYPTDLQTAILYERYDIYKGTLPQLLGKQAQSFKCGRQKGTIFYFEYSSAADRQKAEDFIRRLLWGEDHPNADHPEQIEHAENLLLVIAFEKAPDVLLAAIRAKLPKPVTPS
jgi:hypothetical protein